MKVALIEVEVLSEENGISEVRSLGHWGKFEQKFYVPSEVVVDGRYLGVSQNSPIFESLVFPLSVLVGFFYFATFVGSGFCILYSLTVGWFSESFMGNLSVLCFSLGIFSFCLWCYLTIKDVRY